MRAKILILLSAVFCALPITAQDIDSVLQSIETNSTRLQALRNQQEASKLDARTGIYLPNPEVDFSYMWGRPSDTGGQTDFSVMQSMDFPTAYVHKRRIADNKSDIADFEYATLRRDLLLQTMNICINLVYCNIRALELNKRLQHAEKIAKAYNERFSQGDVDVLERNKAQMNLLVARKTTEANAIERTVLLDELKRLNGGQSITFDATNYPDYLLSKDFDQWFESKAVDHPVLRTIEREIEVSRSQEKLNWALSLPKLAAGYTSESVLGAFHQGIAFNFTIPLFENKNTIKHARLQTSALQTIEADTRLQLYNKLQAQYAKANNLQAMANDYRQILQSMNDADLLTKALTSGQLSLINYTLELGIFYEATDNMLEAERDGWLATSEFMVFEY